MSVNRNPPDTTSESDLRAVLKDIVQRLERVEDQLEIPHAGTVEVPSMAHPAEEPRAAVESSIEQERSLEFEVGQTWFALIGVVVLAIGIGFVLSLPFDGLPQVLPPIGGILLSGAVLLMARLTRGKLETISKYFRGAAMLLLFFSALRLMYFGNPPVLQEPGMPGRVILGFVVLINLTLAWRRKSFHLYVIALLTGYGSAVFIGTTGYLLGMVTLMTFAVLFAQLKANWRHLAPVGFVLTMVTYVMWAIGNPLIGGQFGIRSETAVPVYFVLLWILLFTLASLLRQDRETEDAPVQMTGALICLLGFLTFSLHNLFAFRETFLFSHILASALFISLAYAFWIRERSWFSTFIYVMTGFMALSFALIRAFAIPEVFVALSLQSLVVIASAIYFRSRFIIVANCLIFIGIIGGYLSLTQAEQGMSLGFGVVALISARILNWKKDRLALKTDLMRNAYLVIAFLIFPYALFYLVPEVFVAVAWVGLALFYYGMNLFMRNRKYRWMGHATLLITVAYLMFAGIGRLEGNYRIASFLVLGSIMLVVSIIFTVVRAGKGGSPGRQDEMS